MPSNKCISSMPTVSFDVNYIIFLQDRLFKTVSEQYICSWFCWRSAFYELLICSIFAYETVPYPYSRVLPCHRCLPTIRWTSASSDSSVTLLFETAGVLFIWRRLLHFSCNLQRLTTNPYMVFCLTLVPLKYQDSVLSSYAVNLHPLAVMYPNITTSPRFCYHRKRAV